MPGIAALNGALRRVPVRPLYVLGFVPALWWLYLGLTGGLGAEPVRELEHRLGELALQLLIASLLVTPLLQVTRINLIRFRRMIGLMGFYYIVLHFAVYLALDLQLNWAEIGRDLTKRPYIIMGFAAMLLLVPVAASSNDLSLRRLGTRTWRNIHKLVFPAALLGAAHYIWLVKSWPPEPLIYGAVVLALVLWRPLRARRQAARRRMAEAG